MAVAAASRAVDRRQRRDRCRRGEVRVGFR